MTRVLVFLLFVLALGLGFSWLADRPGEMLVAPSTATSIRSA